MTLLAFLERMYSTKYNSRSGFAESVFVAYENDVAQPVIVAIITKEVEAAV